LKANGKAKVESPQGDILHLSQACLHEPKDGKNYIQVQVDGRTYALACLEKGKKEHDSFDLFFNPSECTFMNAGKSEVHLTGYFEPDEDMGEGSESDEAPAAKAPAKAATPKASPKAAAPKASPKVEPKKATPKVAAAKAPPAPESDDEDDMEEGEEEEMDEESEEEVPVPKAKTSPKTSPAAAPAKVPTPKATPKAAPAAAAAEDSDDLEDEEEEEELEESEEEEPPAPPPAKKAKVAAPAAASSSPKVAAAASPKAAAAGSVAGYVASLVKYLKANGKTSISLLGSKVPRPKDAPKMKVIFESNKDKFVINGQDVTAK